MVIQITSCQDQTFRVEPRSTLFEVVTNLTILVTSDLPPKGDPFPKINGPKPSDHVCIIGAGPAGIHMAVSLKEKGYQNIKIFEKTGRVGGKSYDTQIEGIYRPQGTCFLTADYFENFIELAKKYNVGELNVLPSPGVCKHTISSYLILCPGISCLI